VAAWKPAQKRIMIQIRIRCQREGWAWPDSQPSGVVCSPIADPSPVGVVVLVVDVVELLLELVDGAGLVVRVAGKAELVRSGAAVVAVGVGLAVRVLALDGFAAEAAAGHCPAPASPAVVVGEGDEEGHDGQEEAGDDRVPVGAVVLDVGVLLGDHGGGVTSRSGWSGSSSWSTSSVWKGQRSVSHANAVRVARPRAAKRANIQP
jgi:hypothetical protein